MQKLSALLSFAFLAFVISSCAQPTGPAASGDRSMGAGHAIFDIPTPSLGGSSTGQTINLSWSNVHVLVGGTDMGEFWGSEQVTLREGSGHTDVFMWDAVNNEWDELGSTTSGVWQLTNMADGTYKFMVKEKSLEGFSPNQFTHHSENSNEFEVTVTSCDQYTITGTGGNVVSQAGSLPKNANVWSYDFQLYHCGSLVSDGTTVKVTINSVTYTATYTLSTNTYHFNFPNPTKGTGVTNYPYTITAFDGAPLTGQVAANGTLTSN